MKKVICNFSLFDMEQTVYIHTEENGSESYQQIGKCSLEDLPQAELVAPLSLAAYIISHL